MENIFDIFSKKKSPEKEKTKVFVDYREKNSLVYSELISLGLNPEIMELKVADYIINDVAIERKEISDFISSMLNKRLVFQLKNLQQYKNRILIIEGIDEKELYSDEKSVHGVHPNAVRGFLLSIILDYETPIIFTKDGEDTARFISVLSKRQKKEASLNISRKNLDKGERMQFILESFPGIGPKTAKKLLEHFMTLRELFNASQNEIEEIIGKKADVFGIIDENYPD
ncbi:MAG: helix-hairpin-helix domain-containing protein [Candidatus Pacearchaeota archaeon]|nr:helix-hairpin-helix domain-containing protein [Candidatus Pacearchaeota archaeon]